MGDKIAAKAAVAAFGVPVVPGIAEPGLTDADLIAAAGDIGFPVLVKPRPAAAVRACAGRRSIGPGRRARGLAS